QLSRIGKTMSQEFNRPQGPEENDDLQLDKTGGIPMPERSAGAHPGAPDSEPLDVAPGAGIDYNGETNSLSGDVSLDLGPAKPTASHHTAQPVNKLSDAQLRSIQERLNASAAVSDKERDALLTTGASQPGAQSIGQPTSPAPQAPPTMAPPSMAPPTMAAPTMAPSVSGGHNGGSASSRGPVRGIAYYTGTTITLTTSESMRDGDDLMIRDHRYELRRGKGGIGGGTYVILALALFVVGLFAGPYLNDRLLGGGTIIGVALDQDGSPYRDGAVVRLPDQGFSTVTDDNGMFRFDDLPDGDYVIEYSLPNNLGGKANASISAGDVTVVTLDNARRQTVKSARKEKSTTDVETSSAAPATQSSPAAAETRGSLAVTSNVPGAIVFVDDQNLGETNNTFRRMNTGLRNIRVEKKGFHPYHSEVTIEAGKLARVNVTLEPVISSAAPAEAVKTANEPDANDLYLQARALNQESSHSRALSAVNKALQLDPGMADAYELRGQIHNALQQGAKASLDFVRAGEIYRNQRRDASAMTAFANAIDATADNKVAHKVRGDFYAARSDSQRAIEDYQAALQQDDSYYEARLALGIALFNSGAHRTADNELRRARDFNKTDPTLYHYLMLNSLAKNDIGAVNRFYSEFTGFASESQLEHFNSSQQLAAVRRVISD
ncbi:MAG TPA: PEGA domain-containing protein, partial [candidate division Zixibacteria bacterium]|nr:PEGA domain-containing protein [candidate division Zixibacteria bacterium]